MNRLEDFERLAGIARHEQAPRVDVTARVLRSLTAAEPASQAPLVAFAGVSLVAASIMTGWAVHAWLTAADPLGNLFCPLTLVIQ